MVASVPSTAAAPQMPLPTEVSSAVWVHLEEFAYIVSAYDCDRDYDGVDCHSGYAYGGDVLKCESEAV